MSAEELRQKLDQVVVAAEFYDELGKQLIKDNVELENVKTKMNFAKQEILKLLLDAKQHIEEIIHEGI
ncbi:hypothetical protein DRJ17_06565 [Candidatus Woesearchaeota archaeon]|nr:MAG: hypothetical protein DRJ17_06565 [Candidatus Woesearchaeota archaeon]